MQIRKVKEVSQSHGIKAMLHGPSGSGKTFSITTIPEPETVLILSAESGLLSIKETAANMDVVVIDSINQLRDVYTELLTDTKYKTIVLDSLTEIAQQILSETLANNKDGRAAYGDMQERAVALIKSYRDLPGKNVILICQSERQTDSQGRVLVGPSMPGKKLPNQLPYLADIVACLRNRKDEDGTMRRAFQFTPDEEFVAKKRNDPKSPEVLLDFEPADWSVIFGKLNATHKGGN